MNDSSVGVLPHPGMCEHVTKMGRLGKVPMTSESPRPQFRKLPIQRPYREVNVVSPPKSPSPEPKPRPVDPIPSFPPGPSINEERFDHKDPYVEMKLGRNMRAAPKGSLASKHSDSSVNTQQLDREPLLHNQPVYPSNNIVEYYTNTHCATTQPLPPQGSSITSRQYPTRSITSPQHPSQDLIEMLNRNNQSVIEPQIIVEPRVSTAAERQERLEAELLRLKEMENLTITDKSDKANNRDTDDVGKPQGEVQVRRVSQADSPKSARNETTVKSSFVAPPPPMSSLYGSYRPDENYKPSDVGSTQPFSPQVTESHNQRSTTESSAPDYTAERHDDVNKRVVVEKQETVEEVDDITEDIEVANDDSDNDKIKDDDFNF